MRDTKLFETILGITTPWHVARVELKTEDKRVDLWLEHEATRWSCPECGDVLPGFDHAEARTWRHLDTYQCETSCTRRFRGCCRAGPQTNREAARAASRIN
jgi:transposase